MIEILPNAPENVMVDIISETALKISWSRPSRNYETVTHYYVNISALDGFDTFSRRSDAGRQNSKVIDDMIDMQNQPLTIQVKVRYFLFFNCDYNIAILIYD